MTAIQRQALDQAQDLLRHFPAPPAKPRENPLTKPCGCGNPDCLVVQRENEKPYAYNRRRYATRACWPTAAEFRGALIAPLDWLVHAPPGRIIAQRQAQGFIP